MIPQSGKIQAANVSNPSAHAGTEFGVNRRRHGRVRCDDVATEFGALLDISASGMRVRCGGRVPRVGEAIMCAIDACDGPCVVRARAIWSRRTPGGESEVGFEFLELAPATRDALNALARRAMMREGHLDVGE